jgi:hypothetical protein
MATIENNNIIQHLGSRLKAAVQLIKTGASQAPVPINNLENHSPEETVISEKRMVHQRVRVKFPVRFREIRDENETEITAEHHDRVKVSYSKNLSEGGMFIVTKEELYFDYLLRLHIFLPSTSIFITTLAPVIWTDQEGAGVSFVAMEPRDMESLKAYIGKIAQD